MTDLRLHKSLEEYTLAELKEEVKKREDIIRAEWWDNHYKELAKYPDDAEFNYCSMCGKAESVLVGDEKHVVYLDYGCRCGMDGQR